MSETVPTQREVFWEIVADRDALRAENEQLAKDRDGYRDAYELQRERGDDAEAENERLRERLRLEAQVEIERLRVQLDEEHQAFLAEQVATQDALRENERLRRENEIFRNDAKAAQAAFERGHVLEAENERQAEQIAALQESLTQRGPYCAQHGERQPCSQHRWAADAPVTEEQG